MRVRCPPSPTAPGTALGYPKGQSRGQARGHRPPAARSGLVLTPAGEGLSLHVTLSRMSPCPACHPALHVTLPYVALCPMSFCPYMSLHPYVTLSLQVTPA